MKNAEMPEISKEVPKPAERAVPEMFRARRLERGLILEKIRDDIKTPVKYLLALEEGRYDVFPARVYCRGFFLSYAKYLGLSDPLKLWDRIQSKEIASVAENGQAQPEVPWRAGHAHPASLGSKAESDYWGRLVLWAQEGQNWILAYLVFPALLFGFFYGTYSFVQHRNFHSVTAKSLDIPELLGQRSPVVGAPQAGAGAKPPLPGALAAEFKLELSALSDPSWVQIHTDGRLVFQGILPAFQRRGFRVKDSARLRMGNPRGIEISVNGSVWGLSFEELQKSPLEIELTSALVESHTMSGKSQPAPLERPRSASPPAGPFHMNPDSDAPNAIP